MVDTQTLVDSNGKCFIMCRLLVKLLVWFNTNKTVKQIINHWPGGGFVTAEFKHGTSYYKIIHVKVWHDKTVLAKTLSIFIIQVVKIKNF